MNTSARAAGPLRLRPTMLSDLDFVASVEDDPANRPFITPWERVQHEGAMRFPDFRHHINVLGRHGFLYEIGAVGGEHPAELYGVPK